MTAAGDPASALPRASGRLDWRHEGARWPNRDASRFVEASGRRWHVQIAGRGPVLLLLHGTGASTHSWRALLPLLATRFTCVAPDLPGHAFTDRSREMSLPGMARALHDLLRALDLTPAVAVGHSAGAAILARLCLDRRIAPAGLIALNGALLPIGGLAGQVFSPLARLMASTPVVPMLFARLAGDGSTVERLLAQTGSVLEPEGTALYGRLMRDPAHAAGALAMMANWNLKRLAGELPGLTVPLLLVVGSKDGSVPPSDAQRIRALLPAAMIEPLRGLGHLAHEEAPQRVAAIIVRQSEAWLSPGAEDPALPVSS